MKLHFLGGADEVGASCTLIEIEEKRILVDAGIRMGVHQDKQLPNFSVPDDVGMPDEVLITHAHTDHTGALPVLVNGLPADVKMYCTPATKAITRVLLEDTANRGQREQQDGKLPLCSPEDVAAVLERMVDVPWDKPVSVCDGALTARWIRAGHILGAAMIYIEGKRESILMTGDVSVANQLTIPGMVVPQCRPDVMVMESTYGNRCHKDRANEKDRLVSDVAKVIESGGKVLIPAFAVGRAQEVVLILARAMRRKQIPEFPIWIDGMVQSVNKVYATFGDNLAPAMRGRVERDEDIFYSDTIKPVPRKFDRDSVASWEPCCIVASSGMLIGGRSSFYAEKLAGDPKNLIAITGYQAEGTPGRKLQDDRVLNLDEQEEHVECDVKRYSLSAHADQKQLANLVERLKPHTCFLVHGDDCARKKLAESVRERALNVDVQLPKNGGEYTYTKRAGIADGREFCRQRISELYDYLIEAGEKGPFRVWELAEMWFGTEKMTLINEKVFHLSLKYSWKEFFVPDRQSPELLHPVLIA
ncbi:MAG: MBL fold metallo-hydrolase [Gemmatimonadota bacterium]|nr:MBL fold metallo-hydrolase [Gemmatimonadota bacterium]